MKKFLFAIVFAIAGASSVCAQTDNLEEKVKMLEEKVAKLEQQLGTSTTDNSFKQSISGQISKDRCQQITRRGTQCKRNAIKGSIYCTQHKNMNERKGGSANVRSAAADDDRCQAITKKGTRCKRKAQPGRKFCFQH